MGVERIVVAAKIDQANRDWLEYLKAGFYPFSITTSGLINSLLTIIRLMAARNEIALTPESLQAFLRKDRVLGMRAPFPRESELPVLPVLPEPAPPQAVLFRDEKKKKGEK